MVVNSLRASLMFLSPIQCRSVGVTSSVKADCESQAYTHIERLFCSGVKPQYKTKHPSRTEPVPVPTAPFCYNIAKTSSTGDIQEKKAVRVLHKSRRETAEYGRERRVLGAGDRNIHLARLRLQQPNEILDVNMLAYGNLIMHWTHGGGTFSRCKEKLKSSLSIEVMLMRTGSLDGSFC